MADWASDKPEASKLAPEGFYRRASQRENQSRIQQNCSQNRQERGGLTLVLPSQRPELLQNNRTTGEPGTERVSGTSELRSCAILTEECREAHNLLPLKEPVNFRVKCGGNCLPQRISGFTASVYDPAQICLVNAHHLGQAVLTDPCFIDCQLQVRVNRSLVEFHFLLASLDFGVRQNFLRAPKSTTS